MDVRIVATTNRNLEHDVAEGNFREDLFYRLNVIPVDLPPLRERGDDIHALMAHYLAISVRRWAASAAFRKDRLCWAITRGRATCVNW